MILTENFTLEAEMKNNCIPVTSLIRRIAIEQTPGYVSINCEDWNMWISIMRRGWKFRRCPYRLFNYRIRRGSRVEVAYRVNESNIRLIASNHPELYNEHIIRGAVKTMENSI